MVGSTGCKDITSFLVAQMDIAFNPDVGRRFKEAYQHLREKAIVHTQKDFAKLLGSNEANVSRLFRGDARYTTSSLVSRITLASGITFNEDYLLRGEGTLLKDDPADEAPQKPHRTPKEVEVVPPGSRIVQRLPIIPIKAQAGVGKGFLYDRDESQDPEDVYEEFDTMEVALEREVSDRYKLFRVTGNSMDDDSKRSICDGDVVLCREVYPEDWRYGLINTKYPYVVIVIEEEGVLIKELIKHSRKDNTITLHSLNRNYEDFTKSLSDVRAFFYVERIDRSVQVW